MKKKIQSIGKLSLAVLAVLTFTSCNRGIGCPSDFSVGKVIASLTDFVQYLF